MSRTLDARAETSNEALFYVKRMTDKRMRVYLSIEFEISQIHKCKSTI
jgi:hypothetical protein